MKEIYAIIQVKKLNATKKALSDKGIYPMSAFNAVGHGRDPVEPKVLEAAAKGREEAIALLGKYPPLVSMRSISVMAPDDKVDEIVRTIIGANQTGNPGDGKIFICPIEEAVRIRTGERGDTATL